MAEKAHISYRSYIGQDKNIHVEAYGDTQLIQYLQRQGWEAHHIGFGYFRLDKDDTSINFDRIDDTDRGRLLQAAGFVGRAHEVYPNARAKSEAFFKMLKESLEKGEIDLVPYPEPKAGEGEGWEVA